MDFSYKFLMVGDGEEIALWSRSLGEQFPKAQSHTVEDPAEAADFCQANVYDLIFASSRLGSGILSSMRQGIRELQNDNFTTGLLIVGEATPVLDDLSHVMSVSDMNGKSFMNAVRTLISLKY